MYRVQRGRFGSGERAEEDEGATHDRKRERYQPERTLRDTYGISSSQRNQQKKKQEARAPTLSTRSFVHAFVCVIFRLRASALMPIVFLLLVLWSRLY